MRNYKTKVSKVWMSRTKNYNRDKNKRENITSILLREIIISQRKKLKEDLRRTKTTENK